MLKFGTTSVNGYLTISLECEVIGIIISGYTTNNAAQIRVGDSLSSDWTNDSADKKTSLVTCSEMSLSNKDNVETKNISSTTIYFASTNEVKIATTNKKPIYITSIEFIVAASVNE
jgi:gluconate kinase